MVDRREVIKILARNLSSLRKERGISLTGLAERAGISKSTLSSLEAGETNPTISTIWALADALGVPFGRLVSETGAAEVVEAGVSVRLIEQSREEPRIEVYLMRLKAEARREATPHSPGVVERVFIINGRLLVGPLNSPSLLKAGETLSFKADQPHVYIALDEPVSALVTVEYPKEEVHMGHCILLRSAPRTEEEWEGVYFLLQRIWEEVSQGIPVFRLKLYGSGRKVAQKLDAQLRRLMSSNFSMPVKLFVVEEGNEISVLAFSTSRGRVQMKFPPVKEDGILKQAMEVLAIARKKNLPKRTLKHLHELLNGDSLTLSVLAAEVLLHHAQPAVPPRLLTHVGGEVKIKTHETETPLFEHRINVDVYNFFELLHPGYASQQVALANILHRRFDGMHLSTLDVGTGPGLHLRMLLELYPSLEVLAVDPSPTACAYLKRNLAEAHNVKIHQADFLGLKLPEQFQVIISVGTSHHINTSFFLQKAYDLLEEHGLLLVADEFISPYTSATERNRELIRHHTTYMLATLVDVPESVMKRLSPEETELVKLLSREIPLLAYEAEIREVEAAVARARELFSRVRKLEIPVRPLHPLLTYYRFVVLELEALMAGLDYEVERKTFPEHFLTLAESAGFQLEEHYRVYATTGYGKFEGGTHVFALRREV